MHSSNFSEVLYVVSSRRERETERGENEHKCLTSLLSFFVGRNLTPERRATLQAGIAALMQGEKQRGGSGFVQGGKQTSSAGLAWDIPISKPQAAQKKSLIIPGKLQVNLPFLDNHG